MKESTEEKEIELQNRISELIEQVENEPEEWYKLLIEKVVTLQTQVEQLESRIGALEKYENFHSAVIDSRYLAAPAFLRDSWEVRASANLLPDQGFYNQETSPAGFVFRWTKENFYFDLPLNRDEDRKIELHLVSAIQPELLDDIRCYADGEEIVLEQETVDKTRVYTGTLKKAQTVLRPTRLSFHARTSYSPKELDPESVDTRMLAVTFKKLVVS